MKINGKIKKMVKTGNAKMTVNKIAILQIIQVQTGSPSSIKIGNLTIKVIIIKETEKDLLGYLLLKITKRIIMEWKFASNAIKTATFLETANRQVKIIEINGKGKAEMIFNREEIIFRGNHLKII